MPKTPRKFESRTECNLRVSPSTRTLYSPPQQSLPPVAGLRANTPRSLFSHPTATTCLLTLCVLVAYALAERLLLAH